MIGRLLVSVAVTAVAVVLVGCGNGSSHTSTSLRPEAFLSARQVGKVLYPGGQPGHFGRLTPLANLQSDKPYGDLDEYTFYVAKKNGEADPFQYLASLTVLQSVAAARASARQVVRNQCQAHSLSNGEISIWQQCAHFRVGNVLLIIDLKDGLGGGATLADRRALIAVLRRLGTPSSH